MENIYLIAAVKCHTIVYFGKNDEYGGYWSQNHCSSTYKFSTEEYALDFIKRNNIEPPDNDWTLTIEKWERTAVIYC